MRYLKKTDWGNYWRAEPGISKAELVERSLTQVAQLGVSLQTPPGGPKGRTVFGNLEIDVSLWRRPAGPSKVPAVGRATKYRGR